MRVIVKTRNKSDRNNQGRRRFPSLSTEQWKHVGNDKDRNNQDENTPLVLLVTGLNSYLHGSIRVTKLVYQIGLHTVFSSLG